MFGSTNGNGKAKGINTSGSVKGSFVCLFCLVQYHSMEAAVPKLDGTRENCIFGTLIVALRSFGTSIGDGLVLGR